MYCLQQIAAYLYNKISCVEGNSYFVIYPTKRDFQDKNCILSGCRAF